MSIQILVATHKDYWMPEEAAYVPVQVGAALHASLGFTGDDTGETISIKNPNYNELTAVYWAWKNLSADVIGLVHYRRYFTSRNAGGNIDSKKQLILTKEEILTTLETVDMILPKQRNYVIESSYSHYAHAHNAADLDETRLILEEKFPAYLDSFDEAMAGSKAHMFNMFIMKQADFSAYCEWLFAILFELEQRIDITGYSDYEARVFGFISERLLDVWVNYHQKSYREYPVTFMESQNWLVKGGNFLKRKFFNKM